MHELALMEELRQLATSEAQRQGASQILLLHLRIGSLCGVDPEALRLAFDVVMAHGSTAQARLELEVVPTRCFCANCQQPFSPLDVIHACPHCGALSRQVLAGHELDLIAMEVV